MNSLSCFLQILGQLSIGRYVLLGLSIRNFEACRPPIVFIIFLSIVTLIAMKAHRAMRDVISRDPKSSSEVRFEVIRCDLKGYQPTTYILYEPDDQFYCLVISRVVQLDCQMI